MLAQDSLEGIERYVAEHRLPELFKQIVQWNRKSKERDAYYIHVAVQTIEDILLRIDISIMMPEYCEVEVEREFRLRRMVMATPQMIFW